MTDRKPANRFIPQPVVFVLEVAGRPTLAFEATSAREAKELLRERWLLDDLLRHRTNGRPLWDGKEKLRTGLAVGEHLDVVKAQLKCASGQHSPSFISFLSISAQETTDKVAAGV